VPAPSSGRIPASKLTAPAAPAALVRRPALERRLDEAFGRRLTTLSAGAGFGKTTLLAEWAEDVDCAWYTVGARDSSLPVFARGIVAALQRVFPDLTGELQPDEDGEETLRAEAFAADLCERLEAAIRHDVVFVLDDLHELGAAPAAWRLVETLCRQAPYTFHLVLASRLDPPFSITRLRGRGEVLELNAADLAFSAGEVEMLVAEVLADQADGLAALLHAATGGWPAEVRLALEALQRVPAGGRKAALERLRRPEGPLFAYVAEEVLAGEAEEVRDLLRRVAWLDRIDPALCEALGIHGASEMLGALARRGLLVQAGSEGSYSLHTLLRDFLLERLPLARSELRRLERRAARWFAEQGRMLEALRCSIAAGDAAAVRRLLAEEGDELLAGGGTDEVLRAAELLPSGAHDGRVEQIVGEAHARRGQWDDALACYARAAGDAETLPPALAWRIGRIHFDRGEPESALEAYLRGRADGSNPTDEALLLAWTASAHLSRGRLDDARGAAAQALERATASGEARALAIAHNVSMVLALRVDPANAEKHYRIALDAVERAGDAVQALRIRSNHVAHLLQQGAYDAALAELEVAIRLAEGAGAPLGLAFVLLKRGETQACLGRLDLALADFEAARPIYERMGSSRTFGLLMEMGEIYRERGDRALARSALEAALRGAEPVADAQVVVYAQANLAQVLGGEDPDQACALAEHAVELSRASGHGVVFALLSLGWVCLARDEHERAAAVARESAAAARDTADRPGLAESLELEAMSAPDPSLETARLDEALAIWRELGNPVREARARLALARLARDHSAEALAVGRLQKLGVRPGGIAVGLVASLPPEDPVPVVIRTLGGFGVLREGKPVPDSAWQSKKARVLLKILAARRGRPLSREAMMEALWPEEDPAKTANRLSVALAVARSVLDPERHFPSEHFIGADRDRVALNLDHLELDVQRFLATAEQGLALLREQADEALSMLEHAERAYAGGYLPEDADEDWSVALREEARSTYVAVARALSAAASASGDREAAVRYRLRILELDRYDEEAHLGLVSALVAAGRHGDARRHHRAYATRMEEIGVEAAPFPTAQRERSLIQP
jgi:ATP/maltotriose-dependent transcriptional regulator MalT/DNA-binding SARP family transcriptional activator